MRWLIGSSPRVWGTRKLHGSTDRSCRFIPACVGNSGLASCPRPAYPVHPRVCGELAAASNATREPSVHPRVCGELTVRLRLVARFIPACVGNSKLFTKQLNVAPVHPRVCGELLSHCVVSVLLADRFIPACVGNSVIHREREGVSSVHPRVCGEL